MIKVRFKNLARVQRAFKKAPAKMSRGLRFAMARAGVFAVREVKSHITAGTNMWKPPIDTGDMRRHIQIAERRPLQVTIRPSKKTPYARFVHDGTWKMKARPFFEITEKHSRKDIERFFQKELDKIARTIL